MNEWVWLTLMVLIWSMGYVTGRNVTRNKRHSPRKIEEESIVQRIKPNLRNPLRTSQAAYEPYRTKGGLYAPVKPKGGGADEVDMN